MTKDCAIARDLMPPVIDQIASDESRAFVEQHVAACEPCAQVYADMQSEIQTVTPGAAADSALSFKAAMGQLRKTMGWRRLKTTVLAVVLVFALLIGGYGGYYYLCVYSAYTDVRALPLDVYKVSVYRGSNGVAYGATSFSKYYTTNGSMILREDDGDILYIYWTAPYILIERSRTPFPNPQYGIRMTITQDGNLTFGDTVIQEIRQGKPDDYRVVYRAGDELEPMDPVVDEYLQKEQTYFNQYMEAQQENEETAGPDEAAAE